MMINALVSKGYLLVDPKKCAGCGTCMLACSLAHEGRSNLSLSRIQVFSDTFGSYPTDVAVFFCRQCENPLCYFACPLPDLALCIDAKTGVRYIDAEECTGCYQCVEACPYTPSRIIFRPDQNVAVKCDLCRQTPYWDGSGKQACVAICPMKAIRFTEEKPDGPEGYTVNLRGDGWAKLKFPTD
jgi:protein NrfC